MISRYHNITKDDRSTINSRIDSRPINDRLFAVSQWSYSTIYKHNTAQHKRRYDSVQDKQNKTKQNVKREEKDKTLSEAHVYPIFSHEFPFLFLLFLLFEKRKALLYATCIVFLPLLFSPLLYGVQ